MENLIHYFDLIINYIVVFIAKIGYPGIFFGMFLESTFLPVPSELIMIPAGILVAEGKMNFYIVVLLGTFGSLGGAYFNYFLAISLGRTILFKIGKYFFITPATIIKTEEYFEKHGSISTFVGRLIPGVRHYISLQAGISRMNLTKFAIYTLAGSFIWCVILPYLGFIFGKNQELVREYLDIILISCLVICALIIFVYIKIQKRKNLKNLNKSFSPEISKKSL